MNVELRDLCNKYIGLQAKRDLVKKQISEVKKSVDYTTHRKEILDELQVAVQQCAARTQNKVRDRFVTIVQSCMDVVFPGEYEFHLDFVPRRGKTEVDIYLTKDGNTLDPMQSNGGGLVDVISIALRVACLTMSNVDKILFLDEPMKCLRGDAKSKMGELLNMLSHKLGIQIICVADVSGNAIPADREFLVTKNGGVSKITVVDNGTR